MRNGEERRVLLSCVIPKTVTAKIYSGSPGGIPAIAARLKSREHDSPGFSSEKGEGFDDVFSSTLRKLHGEARVFYIGHRSRCNQSQSAARRQLPQFTPILFSSIRPFEEGYFGVTDPRTLLLVTRVTISS